MKTDLAEIRLTLINMLTANVPPLKVNKNSSLVFEVTGTKEVMQGKQKVPGFYFGSVVPKPKDVRLYFFPIYTNVNKFDKRSEELKKCLKGKSCFHIKKLSAELEIEIEKMIKLGVALYKKDNLI
ncbi:MAG: hypothetical protein IPM56_01545 [Ignavibacteriales bacterium]|nr:MAG: hypothetical protein IPM56_01545 [Ignavibacteriales bacterium]